MSVAFNTPRGLLAANRVGGLLGSQFGEGLTKPLRGRSSHVVYFYIFADRVNRGTQLEEVMRKTVGEDATVVDVWPDYRVQALRPITQVDRVCHPTCDAQNTAALDGILLAYFALYFPWRRMALSWVVDLITKIDTYQ